MKLHLLSDLHNEFLRSKSVPSIAATDADLIVLAGDIDTGLQGLAWAVSEAQRLGKPLIYVSVNHEYYRSDISLTADMRADALTYLMQTAENPPEHATRITAMLLQDLIQDAQQANEKLWEKVHRLTRQLGDNATRH
jgi:Icc-related predicted phosphoesterase